MFFLSVPRIVQSSLNIGTWIEINFYGCNVACCQVYAFTGCSGIEGFILFPVYFDLNSLDSIGAGQYTMFALWSDSFFNCRYTDEFSPVRKYLCAYLCLTGIGRNYHSVTYIHISMLVFTESCDNLL